MRHNYIIICLLVSLVVTFYCQSPLLKNKYAINDDVRQEIYFYSRFNDGQLFKDDPITDFYAKFNPYGLNLFYSFVARFFDPVQSTKFLPFLMCLLSTLYIFKIGSFLKDEVAGFLGGLIFIFVSWSREIFEFFGTGNGADFGILFCVMFLYYSLKNNLRMVMLCLLLLSLFYPPLLLVCLLTHLLSLVLDFARDKKIDLKKAALFIGILIAVILISWSKYSDKQLELSSLQEMKKMEEFYAGGRKPLFSFSFMERWTNYESGIALDYPAKWLFAVSLLMILFARRKTAGVAKILKYFLLSSFILFIIGTIFMYKLYGPARFVRFSLPVFLTIFAAINLGRISDNLKGRLRAAFIASCALIITASFIPRLQRYYIVAPYPGLYSFLETTPKDALVCGHPQVMDDVPTFSKRKVFVNEETSEPFNARLYPILKERTYRFFDAYYSASLKEVYDFCRKYDIAYLVVRRSHFSKDYLAKGEFYFNPFNRYIKGIVAAKKNFALLNIPQDRMAFKDKDIFVVRTQDLAGLSEKEK